MSTILIIEDDTALAELLAHNLRKAGYDVDVAYDGTDGLKRAQLKGPDLVVLDLMLPVMDGLEVCRRLRDTPRTSEILILMLTAMSEEGDQLAGFSAGADDYVAKPFSLRLLLERIRALERRRRGGADFAADVVSSAGVTVDRRRHHASVAGRALNLTRSEFRLLETLIRHPGRVFTRAELVSGALGGDAIVLERTIDVHIRALRVKLGQSADVIETVRGVGYRFRQPNSLPDAPGLTEN